MQIDTCAHERQGKAITNFEATLPSADSDMAVQVFKDPYLFDFLGTADPRREREPEWAQNTATQAEIKTFILDNAWRALPRPLFSDEEA